MRRLFGGHFPNSFRLILTRSMSLHCSLLARLRHPGRSTNARRLRAERLEDRRMLATLVVQNNLDDSLANLAGDGELSLREAIEIANTGVTIDGFTSTEVEDIITFDSQVFTGGEANVIPLAGAELEITESLVIDANQLSSMVTIDAQQQSRVLNFTPSSGDLSLVEVTITGGSTTLASEDGGGILFDSDGELTLTNSLITGNTIAGLGADGGGISSLEGTVTLINSMVSGNMTGGLYGDGGGIFTMSGSVTLIGSAVSGNTSGDAGAGIFTGTGDVLLINSSLSENTTANPVADGGGVFTSSGDVVLFSSTVSDNTSGDDGGGIRTFSGDVTLANSTVSGNSTIGSEAAGGGIYSNSGSVSLFNSTVTDNQAAGPGGGLFVADASSAPEFTSENSIVAGNTDNGSAPDLQFDPDTIPVINFTLIGDPLGSGVDSDTGIGNLLNENPLLGLLADNGGPTLTHALLPGSPAINGGDIDFNPTDFTPPLLSDQRGIGFARVFNNQIDIGAFELQLEVTPLAGDFNTDQVVNAADYVIFRDTVGDTVPTGTGADADGDGMVTPTDLTVFFENFGTAAAEPITVGGSQVDAAFAAAEIPQLPPPPVASQSVSVSPAAPSTSERVIDEGLLLLALDLASEERGHEISVETSSVESAEQTPSEESLQVVFEDFS